jgi:hypothetical protein
VYKGQDQFGNDKWNRIKRMDDPNFGKPLQDVIDLIPGEKYEIVTPGNTDFTYIGL